LSILLFPSFLGKFPSNSTFVNLTLFAHSIVAQESFKFDAFFFMFFVSSSSRTFPPPSPHLAHCPRPFCFLPLTLCIRPPTLLLIFHPFFGVLFLPPKPIAPFFCCCHFFVFCFFFFCCCSNTPALFLSIPVNPACPFLTNPSDNGSSCASLVQFPTILSTDPSAHSCRLVPRPEHSAQKKERENNRPSSNNRQ